MALDIIITLISALLIGVGCVGIIYPVLPGSLAILTGIVLWAFTVHSAEGWWALGLGGALVIVGMLAQFLLTGRTLKREKIPNSSTLWGAVGAVIGMFVIPVVGLFVGFAGGLYLSESYRRRNFGAAVPATLQALKSMGLGIVVEFACGLSAGTVFTLAAFVYFITA
ncbi:MAG: DUF456 domain-containing protein [Rothia sp. (in: high G+C Gram-positive bacteria)]|nr:DUF456 domain-containing protein [Rothia sp. (in: high G+C Gram-positive bacteria)]